MALKVDLILQLVDRMSAPAGKALGKVGRDARRAQQEANSGGKGGGRGGGFVPLPAPGAKIPGGRGRDERGRFTPGGGGSGGGGGGGSGGGGAGGAAGAAAMAGMNSARMMRWIAGLGAGALITKNFKDSAKAAADFESVLADIDKVADWTPEFGLKEMKSQLLELSKIMPMSLTDLGKMAEQGAAAGIPIKELGAFIQNAAKVSTAFSMTAEESGEAMSKLAAIYRINQEEVVKLADAINVLGDATSAKERDILQVLVRSGANGKQIGLTAKSMSALAAAMLSVGQAPEIVGTALNSVIAKLSTAGSAGKKVAGAFKDIGLSGEAVQQMMFANADVGIVKVLERIDALEPEKKAKALVEIFGLTQQDDVARMANVLPDIVKNMSMVGNSFMNFRNAVADKKVNKGVDAIDAMFLNLNRVGKDKNVQAALKSLGFVVGEFKGKLDGNAGQAMTEVLAKIAAAKNPAQVMSQLGIKSKEAQKAVLELAKSAAELGKAYNEAMGKLKTNTLDATFQKRMQTTKAQMQVFSNLFERMAINFGDKLLPLVNKGMDSMTQFLEGLGYGGEAANKTATVWEKAASAMDGLANGAGFKSFEELSRKIGENLKEIVSSTENMSKGDALAATFQKWTRYGQQLADVMAELKDAAPMIFGASTETDQQRYKRLNRQIDANKRGEGIDPLSLLDPEIARRVMTSRRDYYRGKAGGWDGNTPKDMYPTGFTKGGANLGGGTLGRMSDTTGAGMVGKPTLDASSFDTTPIKNVGAELEKLNVTVKPNVDVSSLQNALSIAERVYQTVQKIGPAADSAAARANRALSQSRGSALTDRPAGD